MASVHAGGPGGVAIAAWRRRSWGPFSASSRSTASATSTGARGAAGCNVRGWGSAKAEYKYPTVVIGSPNEPMVSRITATAPASPDRKSRPIRPRFNVAGLLARGCAGALGACAAFDDLIKVLRPAMLNSHRTGIRSPLATQAPISQQRITLSPYACPALSSSIEARRTSNLRVGAHGFYRTPGPSECCGCKQATARWRPGRI